VALGGEVLKQVSEAICCNLGDPKRDTILRCQRIQQRILAMTASAIMGADSGGDVGLSLPADLDEEEEADAEVEVDFEAVAELDRIGSRSNSRSA
jgi:hypothetical protein